MGVKVVYRSGKLRTNCDRWVYVFLVRLEGTCAVTDPKDARCELIFWQTEVVKERIALP